jgi:hypothetical protein
VIGIWIYVIAILCRRTRLANITGPSSWESGAPYRFKHASREDDEAHKTYCELFR